MRLTRVYRTLFQHKINQENREALQVASLNLHKITLHRAESWFRIIDITKVTSLSLCRCDGAPEALSIICRNSPSTLQLRDFTIEHCEHSAGGDVRGAVNTFLSVVPSLKTISIDLCCASHMVRPGFAFSSSLDFRIGTRLNLTRLTGLR